MNRNLAKILALVTLTIGFASILPRYAHNAYVTGAGNLYLQQLRNEGMTVESRIPSDTQTRLRETADQGGIKYAVLWVTGTIGPLYGLVSLLILFSMLPLSPRVTLIVLVVAFCMVVGGAVCGSIAQGMIWGDTQGAIQGSGCSWAIVTLILTPMYFIVWRVRCKRFSRRVDGVALDGPVDSMPQ